jgi:ubiquinone/menaquinone biosynthesis C-methylase UbiE
MDNHEKGQVAASAAQIYEEFFVPALFIDWPARVLAAADVQAGDRVLDIACGTGILAREAKRFVGASGSVVGIDINEGMLDVARSKSLDIRWETAAAESLPFESVSFDRVVSQFGLMFFQNPTQAIAEMHRVVRPGGKVGVAVWASLEATPGYAAVAKMLTELFGTEVARSIEAPYSLGETQALKSLFNLAGVDELTIQTVEGKARFKSVESWIHTDIKGWTLAEIVDDEGYEALKRAAPKSLSEVVLPDDSVEFDAPAHIVTFPA